MINYIKGNIIKRDLEYLVIENNNKGYKVNTSKVTSDELIKIDSDEMVLLNTEMVVREDDISLFGFATEEELQVFNLLRTVSRVGAKSALKMLSTMHYMEIVNIIKKGDYKTLTKAKGVGTKTAKRIIIDLSEKMNNIFPSTNTFENINSESKINEDALAALLALGYSKKESEGALNEFDNSGLSVEEIIKTALKYF